MVIKKGSFYIMESNGDEYLGIRRVEGHAFEVEGITLFIHGFDGEHVTISDKSTGVIVRKVKCMGLLGDDHRAKVVAEQICSDLDFRYYLTNYFKTHQYSCRVQAFKCLLMARSWMHSSNKES